MVLGLQHGEAQHVVQAPQRQLRVRLVIRSAARIACRSGGSSACLAFICTACRRRRLCVRGAACRLVVDRALVGYATAPERALDRIHPCMRPSAGGAAKWRGRGACRCSSKNTWFRMSAILMRGRTHKGQVCCEGVSVAVCARATCLMLLRWSPGLPSYGERAQG